MSNWPEQPVPSNVRHPYLAWSDMGTVAFGARLLAEFNSSFVLDRLIAESGPEIVQDPTLQQRLGSHPLTGHPMTTLAETGLVTTYARPFSSGGRGFPLDRNKYVPAEMRDTHERLIFLRRKMHAHYDEGEEPEFLREIVEVDVPPDVSSVGSRLEERNRLHFTRDDLLEIERLAWAVADRLLQAFNKTRDHAQRNST